MIIEQLINGTPPSAVNDDIIAIVKQLSPKKKIKEKPSIWTICRAMSALLIIVLMLAAYRLGKANKFGQLNTDGT
eukprot:3460308-Ditylum_brightwellii.AAC.1